MSDFTFNEFLTGILKFNDENVMHIGFNADTEDIIITNWNAYADTSKTLQTNLNGGGGGGGSFETGVLVGDGLAHSTYVTISVTKQYSNFILLIEGNPEHASGDYVGCWGTPSMYMGIRWSNASENGNITPDTRGVYLRFTENTIQFMTAAYGGYSKLIQDANYNWIAW